MKEVKKESIWRWLKWLIIIAVVIFLLVLGIKKFGGPTPVAAAELSGTIGVTTNLFPKDDISNVTNSLIRLDVTQSVATKYNVKIEADLLNSLAVVNEAWIELPLAPSLNLKAGKFLLPFGYASQIAPIDMKLIRSVEYGSTYDAGAEVVGKAGNITYSAAAVNGCTLNNTYDLTAKVAVDLIPKYVLNAGVSYYRGFDINNDMFQSIGAGAVANVSGLALAGEYIEGKSVDGIQDVDMYGQGSIRFKSIEPAARFERIDPDTNTDNDNLDITTLGVNVYVMGTKLSVNYLINDTEEETSNEWLVQLMAKF